MDRPRSPVIDRRELAAALRDLREAAGLTLEEAAAEALDASGAKLSRLETGRQVAGPRDVRDLCRLYRVGEQRASELVALATSAREPGWREQYGINHDDFLDLETGATRIEEFQVSYVPGLLQTRDYARAFVQDFIEVGRNEPWTDAEIAEWLELREARQLLLQPDAGVQLFFVVDEVALLRPVSGAHMRAQVQHLAEVAEQPNVQLRVYPLAAGPSPGQQSGFVLLTLANQQQIGYVESHAGNHLLDSPEELARLRRLFTVLRDASPDESQTPATLSRVLASLP